MKRILSIALAVIMVATLFVLPTSAAAADPAYSYEFKAQDARNWVEGQVIDLGYKGEVATAPVMDGKIGDGEYTVADSIPQNGTKATAAASLPIWVAVKGQYLYLAFEYEGEEARQTIQYDVGVNGNHLAYQGYNRLNGQVKADGTIAGGGIFTGALKRNGYAAGTAGPNGTHWILEAGYSNGVYEVKFDLAFLYRVFGGSASHHGVWESPTVCFSFWYDVTNSGPVGQTHYAYKTTCTAGQAEGLSRAVGWVAKTVIIPETSFELIRATKATTGELGYDTRYMRDSQLAKLNAESAVAPELDGAVGASEYGTTMVHEQDYHTGYGDLTGSYAVKDGYVYAAFQYAGANQNCIVQYGLTGPDGATHISRSCQTVKTDSSLQNQNYIYKNAADSGNWTSKPFSDGGSARGQAIDSAAYSYDEVNGVVTIEIRIQLARLITAFEDAGWGADNVNHIYFMLFPDSNKQMAFAITSAEKNQVIKATGHNYHAGYVLPTVELPAGCVDKYTIDDVDDFEAFGQEHFDAAPSTVKVDGVIGAGEYTASQSYTDLRSADSKAQPDMLDAVKGVNRFSYDGEYIYVGATIVDDSFVYGETKAGYQFNIGLVETADDYDINKVDLGNGVKRVNMHAKVSANGTFNAPTYGGVWRCQKDAESKYPGESDFAARLKGKAPVFAGSYDAETNTITYEFAIKISDIKDLLLIEGDIKGFTFLNYVEKGDGTYGWNLYKTNNVAGSLTAIQNLTMIHNAGAVTYSNDFFGHVVEFSRDFATKDAGSVRLDTKGYSGLRFKTVYSDELLAYYKAIAEARGEEMIVGTLIAPAAYVEAAGEFTKAALEAKYDVNPYVDVKAVVDAPYAQANGVTTYSASIVNIKSLTRDFAAIGYIQVGDAVFYSDVYAVRNVSDIAQAAADDVADAQSNEYPYELSNGKFSCYPQQWYDIIDTLIAK